MPELPEAWLHAASDTFENDFRHFKNYTSASIEDSKSLMRLKPPTWLNDEVLSGYLHLLDESCSNVHITNSYALTGNFRGVKGFVNKDDYLKLLTDIAIIPINQQNNHWTFACVWLKTETELFIEYYDSNEQKELSYCSLPYILKDWINRTFPNDIMVEVQCGSPQQYNGSDCGVFVLMGMRMRAMGWPVFSQQEADDIMPNARHRVFAEIVAGHLNPTSEDVEIYHPILSGEIAFPSPPSLHAVNYVEETDSIGNIILNLTSPEPDIMDVNSATKENIDSDIPNLEPMEMEDEAHLIEDPNPRRRNSIKEGVKRTTTNNLRLLDSDVAKVINETHRGKDLDQLEDTSPLSKMEETGQFEDAITMSNFLTATDNEDGATDPESYEHIYIQFKRPDCQNNPGMGMYSQDNERRSEPEPEPEPEFQSTLELERGNETHFANDDSGIATVACSVTDVTSGNHSQKRSLSAASGKDITNQDDESEVSNKKKHRKKRNLTHFRAMQSAALKFGSQAVLAENLRAAVIVYRTRMQDQSGNASLASLWNDIRPNEHNVQNLLQRNTRLEFARRWFRTQEQLPSHKRERMTGMKRALGLVGPQQEQEKEFRAATTHANRCSFWLELVSQLPFKGDVCREVAVCACGESTSELERMTRPQREEYFDAIRFRIKHESSDIMKNIQAAGSLYKALIDDGLPNHQLVLEGNWGLGDMTFEKLVSLDCVPDKLPIPLR